MYGQLVRDSGEYLRGLLDSFDLGTSEQVAEVPG